ncbi:MAG: DNA pilot protein [Microvirus sp.]|nr:MAG: DNA pilot protein [Microvirus sp.]
MLDKILANAAGPLVSSLIGGSNQRQANEQNYNAQKEFAQNGLQWKAADARAAGLHPLAALGSSGAAFSPSFQAGVTPNFDTSGLFDDMESMGPSGQDTTRAQRAQLSDHDREMQAAVLRNQQLQNSLIEGQLAEQWGKIMGQPSNPPAPGPVNVQVPQKTGQVAQGIVKLEPSKSESQRPGNRGLAAGESPLFRDQVISNKSTWSLLSPDAGETFEAYGELLKPILAAAAHGRRWWDNRPPPITKFRQMPSRPASPNNSQSNKGMSGLTQRAR